MAGRSPGLRSCFSIRPSFESRTMIVPHQSPSACQTELTGSSSRSTVAGGLRIRSPPASKERFMTRYSKRIARRRVRSRCLRRDDYNTQPFTEKSIRLRANRDARCGGLRRAAAGCGEYAQATFVLGRLHYNHLNNDPERSRRHEIPRVPPFSGSFSVYVHTQKKHVCCTGRDLKTTGPPDRHPNPRTTPSHHSHGKSSCPLFVLLSRQAQLSASSSRCSPCH